MTKLTKGEGKRGNARESEKNLGAGVGLLIILLVALLGINAVMGIANFLKEPTWLSPKGCPLFVQGEGR